MKAVGSYEANAVIQVSGPGGLEQGGSQGDGGKWWDPGYILMKIVIDWMCEAWKKEQTERLFYSLWPVAAREPEWRKIEGEASLRASPGGMFGHSLRCRCDITWSCQASR